MGGGTFTFAPRADAVEPSTIHPSRERDPPRRATMSAMSWGSRRTSALGLGLAVAVGLTQACSGVESPAAPGATPSKDGGTNDEAFAGPPIEPDEIAKGDVDVLSAALNDVRILVTRDRDSGNLVFVKELRGGVLYLRMTPRPLMRSMTN